MAVFLRQSTASQEVLLGPFVDSTDGSTAETGLTIANTDIQIWKTGGTTEGNKNSGGATHIAGGRYYCVLDATDTNTIGPMRLSVQVSGALAVWLDCCVLDEAVYDVLFGTTAPSTYAGADTSGTTTLLSRLSSTRAGYLDNLSGGAVALAAGVNVSQWDGNAVSSSETGRPVVAVGYWTDWAGAATVGDVDATYDSGGLWVRASDGTAVATASAVSTLAGYVDTEVAAIKAKTDNLPASPAATGDAMTLTSGERNSIAAALLDLSNGVETSVTMRQALRAIAAALAGNVSGAGTSSEVFRALGNSGTTRLTNVGDSSGNRTVTPSL